MTEREARPAVFLDRDGVINEDIGYLYRPDQFRFTAGALAAARELHELGYALIVVTNQSGIARGYYGVADFLHLTEWMKERFAESGAPLTAVYFCPHHPDHDSAGASCNCRKPAPGMLLQAAKEHVIDLPHSIMVGDKEDDIRAGRSAGVGLCVRIGSADKGVITDADAVLSRLALLPAWLSSLPAKKSLA